MVVNGEASGRTCVQLEWKKLKFGLWHCLVAVVWTRNHWGDSIVPEGTPLEKSRGRQVILVTEKFNFNGTVELQACYGRRALSTTQGEYIQYCMSYSLLDQWWAIMSRYKSTNISLNSQIVNFVQYRECTVHTYSWDGDMNNMFIRTVVHFWT